MNRPESDPKPKKRVRLNVYLRRPGTLQALKMLAITDPGGQERKVRVNDLVNDALEKYVREMISIRKERGSEEEMFWDFLDLVDFIEPGHPDYPDDETLDRIAKEANKEYEEEG